MSTRVVNVRDLPADPKDWPADYVYIGRRWLGYDGHPSLPQSYWRNPYRVGRDFDGERDEVVARFEAWLLARPAMLARLPELKGKTLVCWCAPEHCHGDVLARLADDGVTRP